MHIGQCAWGLLRSSRVACRPLSAASGPHLAAAPARGVHDGGGDSAPHRIRGTPATSAAAAAPAAAAAAATHPVISVPGFVVTAPHARVTTQSASDYMLSHPVYTRDEVEALRTDVKFEPAGPGDRLAQAAILAVRGTFDFLTGYKPAPASNSTSHCI